MDLFLQQSKSNQKNWNFSNFSNAKLVCSCAKMKHNRKNIAPWRNLMPAGSHPNEEIINFVSYLRKIRI